MLNHAIACAVLVATLGGAPSAQSIPPHILWKEKVNGVLPDLQDSGGTDGMVSTGSGPRPGDAGDWQDLGTLRRGLSIVTGEVTTIRSGFSFEFLGDAILFTVPNELVVTSIVFESEGTLGLREFLVVDPATDTVLSEIQRRTFPEVGLSTPTNDDVVARFAGAPLGAGAYVLSYNNAARVTDTSAYTITFEVVPAPGAVGLLGAVGVCAARRRSRG
ncbi:MAG: hypothetical protein AAGI30_12560 [Planctomycetota bacterium]